MTDIETTAYSVAREVATRLSYRLRMDKDEAIAEAFLAVCRKLDKFNPEIGTISGFVSVVVTRSLVSVQRKVYRQRTIAGMLNTLHNVSLRDTHYTEDELVVEALALLAQGKSPCKIKASLRARLLRDGLSRKEINRRFQEIDSTVTCREVVSIAASE